MNCGRMNAEPVIAAFSVVSGERVYSSGRLIHHLEQGFDQVIVGASIRVPWQTRPGLSRA